MKILIAEDEYTARRSLEFVLEKWGYEIISVDNGKSALEILIKDDAPRIALLDWEMPQMDGVEVCARLRAAKKSSSAYIILVTARDGKKDVVTGLEAGANDYVSKPFNIDELGARVKAGKRMIELQDHLLEKEKLQVIIETAGMICHEINQPLMTISGYTEMLLEDYAENRELKPIIKIIKEQTERLGDITGKLMRITRYKTKGYLDGSIVDLETASEKNNKK